METLKSLSSNQRFALNVFVPALYLAPVVAAYLLPKHFGFGYRPLVYAGLAAGLAGLAIWIFAMLCLGRSLAVLPSGGGGLVTRGVYKYLRHPIYVGVTLTLFGLLLACGSVFGMVYLAVIVVPLNLFRARLEEKALLEEFGERYRAYREKTLF